MKKRYDEKEDKRNTTELKGFLDRTKENVV
jgi:hypothetical protein